MPTSGNEHNLVGQLRLVIPGQTGCLFCCGGIDTNEAALDLMARKHRRRRERRGYVRGTAETPTASVIYLNGILSHLALSHIAKLVQGGNAVEHAHVYYNGNSDSLLAAACRPNPECPVCGPGGVLGAGDREEQGLDELSDELSQSHQAEAREQGLGDRPKGARTPTECGGSRIGRPREKGA